MNNKLKNTYRQILENRLSNIKGDRGMNFRQISEQNRRLLSDGSQTLNEMRLPGGWWERLKYIFPLFRRFKSPKYMFEFIHRSTMNGLFNRFFLKFGRGTSKRLDDIMDEINHNLGETLGGNINNIIIQDDGAHILVVGTPPRYYYYASPESGPVFLPNFNPYNDTVPGHIPWNNPDGTPNPDYHSPFEGPLPGQGAGNPTGGPGDKPRPSINPGLGYGLGGIGGGVLLMGDESTADPYNSPSNLPGWHPPMLPPPGGVPTPPWYSPLAPMDPSQPNFGIPGY